MPKLLGPMKDLNKTLTGLVLCSLLLFRIPDLTGESITTIPNYLHTSGNKILDASDKVVGLSGLNWFSFETPESAPHGLEVRNWKAVLIQIKTMSYNVIRIPFSNAMLKRGVMPSGIN
jgi:endoglucanase